MATRKTPKAPNPMRLRTGMWCHFTDAETGKVHQGIFRGGREVEEQLRPVKRDRSIEQPTRIVSVPASTRIHTGKP
jgi:hypothetical protein